MGQLEGKVAIVTGTSRGVGVGISRRLLEEGATVVGCSRRELPELPAAEGIDDEGKRSAQWVCNQEDIGQIDAFVRRPSHGSWLMADPRTRANRETAIRFIERLGKGVLDDTLLADDPQWWVPGMGTIARRDFEGFVTGFHRLCAKPPEMTILGVTAEGDRVAIEAKCEAALKDGTRYCNTYHFLLEFEDGKIKLAKEYNDTRHSTETVGALLLRGSRLARQEESR